MKHKILGLLLVIFIAAAGLLGWSVFSLNQTMKSIQSDLETAISDSSSETSQVDSENSFLQLYAFLYSQLSQYNLQEQYGEQSASLANTLLERTLKNYSIDSIEYLENGLIMTISGNGLPLNAVDEQMLADALTSAGKEYISNNWLSLIGNALKGDEEAIKQSLYEKMAQALFNSLEEQIASKPDEEVHFSLSFTLQDGQWIVSEMN